MDSLAVPLMLQKVSVPTVWCSWQRWVLLERGYEYFTMHAHTFKPSAECMQFAVDASAQLVVAHLGPRLASFILGTSLSRSSFWTWCYSLVLLFLCYIVYNCKSHTNIWPLHSKQQLLTYVCLSAHCPHAAPVEFIYWYQWDCNMKHELPSPHCACFQAQGVR